MSFLPAPRSRFLTAGAQLLTFSLTVMVGNHIYGEPPTTKPVTGLSRNTPNAFVLTDARIVVSPGTTIEKGTIVVRDGHIVSVGETPKAIRGARTLDMTGKTIYAGLIDGYSEADTPTDESGPRHWNPGITPQRNSALAFKPDQALNKQLRRSGVVARLVAPSGGQIKGTSVLVSAGDEEPERAVLRREVAMHVSLTTVRRRDQYPGSPMGAVALVRQALHDATWHRSAWEAYEASRQGLPRPAQNPALDALATWLRQRSLFIVDAQNERYALRADRIAKEFTLPVIAIRGSGREYRRLDAIVANGHPILIPVDFPKAPNVATAESAESVTLQQLQHWDVAPENPARLAAAGATIVLTSDGLKDKSAFLKSVRQAVKRGLDPSAALAALTTNPAKLFGFNSRLGSIEVGKLASFIVTDGELFDDKTKVLHTWVAGVRHKIDAPSEMDARGQWQLRFVDLNTRPKRAKIDIRGSADKPKAKIEVRKETYEVKKITFSDATISARFPATGWGQDGTAMVSFVLSESSLKGQPTAGTLLLPDGKRSTVVAKKVGSDSGDDKPNDGKQETKETADSADPEQAKATAEKEVDLKTINTTDEPDAKNLVAQESDAEESDDEESDDEDSDDEDSDEEDSDEEQNAPALYEVNYPLGAFGRETPPAAENVLFVGATVWTCDEAGIIENGSLLIVDGKIRAVGKGIEVPAGVRTIDLAGKHITPGIIDCHSHIATDGGVNEGTQAITAEVRIGDFIDPDDISIYRQLAGGVTTANILHGSANPIGGQNQVIKLRWGALPEDLKFAGAPAGIKFALGENVKQSNWGDDHRTRYPQTRMGVDQIIIDAFERAKAYAQEWEAWKSSPKGIPPRVDLELEAIAEIIAGKRWIHCHSYRQSEILALMRTCDAYGVTIGSLQHILEGYKLADEMSARGITGSSFSDWWAYKFEVYDAIPYNGALMHEAGVIVSFNSDDAELGRRLNTEAAKAMKYGNVPATEALKFVTLNPAKQLRIDDRVGSLTAGKHADFAIWSGPPMSSYSRCVQTWIDGRRFFDAQQDQEFRSRDRQRHAALVQRILSSKAEMSGPDDKERDTQEFWTRVNEYCLHGNGNQTEAMNQP